jgi:hypothetical protein
MNHTINFKLTAQGADLEISNLVLPHSFGFNLMCNTNDGIINELKRVKNDIKLLKELERIDYSNFIMTVRASKSDEENKEKIIDLFDISPDHADKIMNMELEILSSNIKENISKLKDYKCFLVNHNTDLIIENLK